MESIEDTKEAVGLLGRVDKNKSTQATTIRMPPHSHGNPPAVISVPATADLIDPHTPPMMVSHGTAWFGPQWLNTRFRR